MVDTERVARRFYVRYAAELAALVNALLVHTPELSIEETDSGKTHAQQTAIQLIDHMLLLAFTRPDAIESYLRSQHALPDPCQVRLLAFIQSYTWRLQSLDSNKACITPDILGYVVERRINQKQHGAFYTQDDISDYIARSTIIPHMLNELIAHAPHPTAIQDLLRKTLQRAPERFIPTAVQHGGTLRLPAEIGRGLTNMSARNNWNRPTPAEYGLPGEIWRETIARREYAVLLQQQLRNNPPGNPVDLVALNLDLPQLAHELITQLPADMLPICEQILANLRILDPTCGAGAFLLAAVRVLEGLQRTAHSAAAKINRQGDLGIADRLRQIISNNLYGVDLMPDAVAACRLRLQLLLRAAGDTSDPPALTEQIRVGDALDPTTWDVGFGQVLQAGGFDCVLGNPPYVSISRAQRSSQIADYHTAACGNLYAYILERSLGLLRHNGWCGMIVPIASIATETMAPLQQLYTNYDQWHSHYAVRPGKLFANVDMNLTISLLHKPAAESAQRTAHSGLAAIDNQSHHTNRHYTTGYLRWSDGPRDGRQYLFETLRYVGPHPLAPSPGRGRGVAAGRGEGLAKLGSALEISILTTMLSHGHRLGEYQMSGGIPLYYHSGGRYWRKALLSRQSSHYKPFWVRPELLPIAFGLLNSQLFYWYWIAHSNCMDVVNREVVKLPVFALEHADSRPYVELIAQLLAFYQANTTTQQRQGNRIQLQELSIAMAKAKPLIDQIDTLLAQDYALNEEQLDFIRNYDVKYRVERKLFE